MAARPKRSKKPSVTKAESQFDETTFFVDRSLGRDLGRKLPEAGWKIELHDDHFDEDTTDEEWLIEVGRKGWVVLTKDKAIRRKPIERKAILAATIRAFTLAHGNMSGQEMTAIYLKSKSKIARFLAKHSGPFVAVVSKTGSISLSSLPANGR